MRSVRLGVVLASGSQYIVLAVNFAALAILARLLTPADYGVSALAIAIVGLAEACRELAGPAFLVQEKELNAQKIRTTTTVHMLVTLSFSVLLLAASCPLARLFDAPLLAPYLVIATFGYALGTFVYPQQALLGREMAFAPLALIHVLPAAVGAVMAIVLALLGLHAMSLAYAGVASMVTASLLCLAIRRDVSIYRPSLAKWRGVLAFGRYSGSTALLGKLAEAIPVLVFGRLLGPTPLALVHRALLLCQLPERIIHSAVGMVALPEFSRRAREGLDLKQAYLSALSHIAGAHWPITTTVALLAYPIVHILMGPQWADVAPLMRVLGPALMLGVLVLVQYPALVAAHAVHLLPRLLALQIAAMALILTAAAGHGLMAAAASALLFMPLQSLLSFLFIRRVLGLRLGELAAALVPSLLATAMTAVVPFVFVLIWPQEMPLAAGVLAACLAALTWLGALRLTRHPLWHEMARAAAALPVLSLASKAARL